MAKIGRAFDKHTRGAMFRGVPSGDVQQDNTKPPWELVPQGTMPPPMFQLRFNDGSKNSFAYGDLREVYCRDAGYLTLIIHGAAKYRVVIEGRRLSGLADWFSAGMVRWVQENDPRVDPKPESAPDIETITVELIPE